MGWPLPRSPMNSREEDSAVLDPDPPSGNMIFEAFSRQQRHEAATTPRTVGQLLKQVGDSVRNSPHDTDDDDDDRLPPSPYHHILDFKGMSPAADGSGGQAPPPFVLSFTELTYSVKVRKRSALWRSTGEGRRTRVILDSVSGEAREGEILAVLGASGSGKSTFIDALAGRIAAGSLHGRVTLNGEALDQMGHLLKAISAYVMQDDLLHPMLTVEEVLTFAAEFRLPRSVPRSKKRLRVSDLIDQLGLRDVAGTIIGDEQRRGVSGGERRRVSIGADIIHDPIILFLDEPTSGLDSTSAFQVVHVLQGIARSGSVVVMSVHQPSSRILGLLDRLLFLSRGRAVYSGVPGELPAFFADFGRPVPKKESHAEFALDLILELEAAGGGTEELAQHHRQWQAKHARKEAVAPSTLPRDGAFTLRDAVSASISRGKLVSGAVNVAKMGGGGAGAGAAASGRVPAGSANPFWIEVGVLTKRSFTNSRRQLLHIVVFPQIVVFVTGFMFSAIFWRLPHSVAGIKERLGFLAFAVTATYFTCAMALAEFIQERYIFIRETAHSAYRRSSYVLAGMLTTIPNIFVLSVTFGAVTYFAVGLAGGFSGFLFYLGVVLACYWAGTSYVTFLSGVVPDIQLGFTAVVLSLCSFFLLGGFFLSRDRIPRYWLWLHYMSLVKYGYEAMALNEFGEPGRCFLKGNQLLDQLNPLAGLPPETKAGLLDGLGMMLRLNLTEETCFVNGPYVLRAAAVTDLGKWACLWIIVAWGFIFRVFFYFSLLVGSKNKRK